MARKRSTSPIRTVAQPMPHLGGGKDKHLVCALHMAIHGEKSSVVPRKLHEQAHEMKKCCAPWSRGKGIQGHGVADKISDGEILDELVLKVYVEKKLPKSKCKVKIPQYVPVAGIQGIDGQGDVDGRIKTDVVEIGKLQLQSNTARVRPAKPGFSIFHANIREAGTFGCLVQKPGDPSLYVLSNAHVLAQEGIGNVGDRIVQPGPFDGTAANNGIAQLFQWSTFQFGTSTANNTIDAAIARVNSKNSVTAAIPRIGVPKGDSPVLRRNMQVQKNGRTTGFTIGLIRDVNFVTVPISYNKPSGGKGFVRFSDQVLCTPFTLAGDSGSAVCNMSGSVVGLHFLGSPAASVFNKIGNVKRAFGVEIVTA